MRAASAIALGGLPTAMRASSASVSGVANSAAAATWSSVSAPVLSAWSSAGRLRSALLVRVIRAAVRWSLLETCASHCALEEQPAALPIAVVVGLAHDLRDPLLDARLLLAERAQLAPARLAATLHAPGRPSLPAWRTYVRMVPGASAAKVCRDCAEMQRF